LTTRWSGWPSCVITEPARGLLDWTYSFFVAVYFACEEAKTNAPCVVYALDTRKCVRDAKRQLAAVLALSPDEVDNPEYDALYVDGSPESRERFDRAMMSGIAVIHR
jgi:FRG domain